MAEEDRVIAELLAEEDSLEARRERQVRRSGKRNANVSGL